MNRKLMIGAMLGAVICLSGCGTDSGYSAPPTGTLPAATETAASPGTAEETGTETQTGSTAEQTVSSGQTDSTAATTSGTAAAERLFGGYVALSSGSLNLRSEPNDRSDKLASIPAGTQLDIYAGGVDGWYMVSFDGKTGYVSAKYIKEIEDDDTHAQTTVQTEATKPKILFDGIIDSGEASVDLLREPKNGAKTIDKIPNGTWLEFCESGKDGWYSVHYTGRDGYVKAEYARKNEDTRPPVSDAEKKALEKIAGMWFEAGEMFPRTLVVAENGDFQLDYRGGGSLYGTVSAETANGETWFSFYDEEHELWGRFRKAVDSGMAQLCPDNEDDPYFERSMTDADR